MALHIVVHPRFGDTARVATEASGRPQLVADIDTGGMFCVQVDDEPGSTELAAQFARDLATAALRFAQRCTELIPALAVTAPAAPGDNGASNREGPREVVHSGGRLRASADPAGGRAGVAVSAGGSGRHDRAAACGDLWSG